MPYRGTAIRGWTVATPAQMRSYVNRVNPAAPVLEYLYHDLAPALAIRADLAYAQAIHETDFFRFTGQVRPEQNNFCGLGATGPGNPGHSFATPAEGVLAHLQHLYAYSTTAPLPAGMPLVDPRFGLVQRGSAPTLGGLNGRWAVPGTTYGQSIDLNLAQILTEPQPGQPYSITRLYLERGGQNRPGSCDEGGCWEGVGAIVVHRTASATMNARQIQRYFDTHPDGRFASAQFVIDDREILQLMPIGELAYHTRGKNYTMIGIETCEQNWGRPAWAETYRRLVWLSAYLLDAYNLSIRELTGHFWWDLVNRPFDPTCMGWRPEQGQGRGLFDWNQFVVDVADAMGR